MTGGRSQLGPRMVLCVLLAALAAAVALAGPSASHTVTVRVVPITEITLTGGNITLTASAATAGQQPDPATNTACGLAWTATSANAKITVATSLASAGFTLKVVAQGVTGGAAAPEVTLSNTAADLVTGAGKATGACTLRYAASATAAQGTGSDVHIVTYTLTSE
jgi:hypothetical protein